MFGNYGLLAVARFLRHCCVALLFALLFAYACSVARSRVRSYLHCVVLSAFVFDFACSVSRTPPRCDSRISKPAGQRLQPFLCSNFVSSGLNSSGVFLKSAAMSSRDLRPSAVGTLLDGPELHVWDGTELAKRQDKQRPNRAPGSSR